MTADGTLQALTRALRQFAREREWEQFHTPKNLAMAMAGEAGEVLDIFQWLTPDESAAIMGSPGRATAVRHELADVFAYLLRLADVLNIDLADALQEKLLLNQTRYPVEQARGLARKYTELGSDS